MRDWEKGRKGNFGRAVIYEIISKLICAEMVRNGNEDYVNIEISRGDITNIWSGSPHSLDSFFVQKCLTHRNLCLFVKRKI